MSEHVNPYGADIFTEPESSEDTLANLGPLRPLAGIWGARSVPTSIRSARVRISKDR